MPIGPESRKVISWVLGMALSVVLAGMFFLTLDEGFAMSRTVMVGSLVLIVVLMYGPDAVAAIVEAWRGGGG